MAKKHTKETIEPKQGEQSEQGEQIESTVEEINPCLVTVNVLKCDGIVYQPGSVFPMDHPEAERLFNLGVLVSS